MFNLAGLIRNKNSKTDTEFTNPTKLFHEGKCCHNTNQNILLQQHMEWHEIYYKEESCVGVLWNTSLPVTFYQG